MISRKELALSWGLASAICMTGAIGMAVLAGTNSVLLTFPYGEQYIELVLGLLSIVFIGAELFFGDR